MALVMHPLYLRTILGVREPPNGQIHGGCPRAAPARPAWIACIPPLPPHLFRHTYAHEALSAGMQEGEVMALAGWRSREMLSRYAKSAEREGAIAAARPVNVGPRPLTPCCQSGPCR